MPVTTLKPGLLVSLKTALRGGVQYTRVDIENRTEGDAKRERWETTKVVSDKEEHDRATKLRSKAGSMVRSVCVPSAFGYICPVAREEDLDKAILEAQEMIKLFNESAVTCRVSMYTLKGRIAETDDEAARAINSELRELLDEMKDGIKEADPKRIRDAAAQAKKMGTMLDEQTALKVTRAVEEAREVAKAIVKKLTDKTEDLADYVQTVKLNAISNARFTFLDTEEQTGEAVELPAPVRAIDTADEPKDEDDGPSVKASSYDGKQRNLDL